MTDTKIMDMAKEAFASRRAAKEWFADAAPCFEQFAAMVAAAERERCAKVCDAWGHECHGEGRDDSEAFDCADMIRALGDEQ